MIYKIMRPLGLLFVIMIVCNFTGCFYSFTGASVAPHLKTVSIPVVEDRSGVGEINLREQLTSRLIQSFNNDNTLRVAEKSSADALLECSIVSFNDAPAVIAAAGNSRENVKTRRITITVRVLFKDLVKKKTISEKNYSNYGDYTTENITANRPAGIQSALDKVAEDILIGTVSNW
ncbi:MAG: LPS assembly lipoprotein LptE [Syntrophomonadaceae bacterium]